MNVVAVFDLDGTITRGDTFIGYCLYMLLRRPVRLLYCLPLPLFAALFVLGWIDNAAAKQRLLYAVAGGLQRERLVGLTQDFVRLKARRMVKPKALERMAAHADSGHVLVLATASLDLYAEPLGRHLGFRHVLSTLARWQGDVLAFGLAGANLRADAKLRAVEALVDELGAREVVVYSDHHSDLPLLTYATRAVAVDPTPRLAREAERLGIAVETWR